ncbi:MAG: GNAT family N-acetyltransferase [Nanoarchaeota archaeon]|nr:GNAT family N-acetyltransferase [Nanoarchaeota archaeon]
MSIILQGKRINVRTFKKSDANSLQENINERLISQFTHAPYPYKLQDAKDFIVLSNTKLKSKESYFLGIEFKETGKIIGGISLMDVDWDKKEAELGYWIGKNYRGKGLMKEAVDIILKFGFMDLKLERITADVSTRNPGSRKVVEKMKFKYCDWKFEEGWGKLLLRRMNIFELFRKDFVK